MDLLNITNSVHQFIGRLHRGNFYLSSQSFQIRGLISNMEVMIKRQNFSSISLKLCQLDQKNTGTFGVNNTINEH